MDRCCKEAMISCPIVVGANNLTDIINAIGLGVGSSGNIEGGIDPAA